MATSSTKRTEAVLEAAEYYFGGRHCRSWEDEDDNDAADEEERRHQGQADDRLARHHLCSKRRCSSFSLVMILRAIIITVGVLRRQTSRGLFDMTSFW